MFNLLISLISQGGMIAFFSFVFSKVKIFGKIFSKSRMSFTDRLIIIIFFAGIGIIGTYTGIPVRGALANTRVVGVFVGGLLGGPIVGIFAGIIAGLHRWLIDLGGFTALSCMISTISEGIIAALLWKSFQKSRNKWLFASLFGAAAEVLQMIIILLTARPFDEALDLVRLIGLPMIIGNGIAIGMFIAIADSLFREREQIAAQHSQKVLKIAEKTLPFFRKGLNEETAREASKIILKQLNLAAVSITGTDACLVHEGMGKDHHLPGRSLKTSLTRRVITEGRYHIAKIKEDIDCSDPECPLRSAVIVPLKSGDEVQGALKLYRSREYAITQVDVEVAVGLASLFSLQLEISRLEEQSCLLNRAELKALQSQINPHFLFNAINTVTSFVRTKPEKARELLLDLSDYYRYRLHEPDAFIPLGRELEHIRTYLEIEQARFDDRLEVLFPEKSTPALLVPPLILQPLVENAVKHGVAGKVEGGKIHIEVEEKKEGVIIRIEDNGAGMDKETVSGLLSGKGSSVGLINVHRRLINAYGPSSGLNINSKKGKGTCLWMTIPSE